MSLSFRRHKNIVQAYETRPWVKYRFGTTVSTNNWELRLFYQTAFPFRPVTKLMQANLHDLAQNTAPGKQS